MRRLLVIDDRDQTVEMCHRQLPQFDYLTRCDRRIPCQVCEERDRGCALKCAHDFQEAAEVLARTPGLPIVMLTTTTSDLGADRPADPLLYFCENEVVDSRSLAAEITHALSAHQ